MYAKANFRDNGIIIPDNYSGNAFSSESVVQERITTAPAINEIAKETKPIETEDETAQKPDDHSLLAALMPPKVSSPSGFLSNVGLEELVIIGILILLMQSNSDDDILLLLFLLLFYK